MHPELEQLLILQDRQQKIRQIQTEIKILPQQRSNLEAQLAASVAGVEALKQKGRQVEVDRKRLELDVGTRNDSIAKLRTQQYETRKNDEFQAMGHEIQRYENEIKKIEDEELDPDVQGRVLRHATRSGQVFLTTAEPGLPEAGGAVWWDVKGGIVAESMGAVVGGTA